MATVSYHQAKAARFLKHAQDNIARRDHRRPLRPSPGRQVLTAARSPWPSTGRPRLSSAPMRHRHPSELCKMTTTLATNPCKTYQTKPCGIPAAAASGHPALRRTADQYQPAPSSAASAPTAGAKNPVDVHRPADLGRSVKPDATSVNPSRTRTHRTSPICVRHHHLALVELEDPRPYVHLNNRLQPPKRDPTSAWYVEVTFQTRDLAPVKSPSPQLPNPDNSSSPLWPGTFDKHNLPRPKRPSTRPSAT